MDNCYREDTSQWFDYHYSSSQRLIYLGSHRPDSSDGNESGVDCKMAEMFVKAMIDLDEASAKPIFVHMNNIGGSVQHGLAIYDIIKASRCIVNGICWGHATSMGSIILQACDVRLVSKHCVMMIHDGFESLSGQPKSIENWTKYNAKLRKHIYEIYLARMKVAKPRMTISKVEELCSHDTIFSADQAVAYGLADAVLYLLDDLKTIR